MVRWLIGATVLACGAAAFAGDAPEKPKVITNEDLPPLPGASVPGPLRVAQDWRLELKIPDDVLRQLDGDARIEARREAAAEWARERREERDAEPTDFTSDWIVSSPRYFGLPVGRFRGATCLNGACLGGGLRYDGLWRTRPTPEPTPTRPAPRPGASAPTQSPQSDAGTQSPAPQPRPSAPAQAPRQQFAPRAGGAAAPAGR